MILLTLLAIGAGISSAQLNYYRTRASAETFFWDLRRIQETARARGFGASPHGIKLYQGRIDSRSGAIEPVGFSYLVYGVNASPIPPDALAALSTVQRGELVALSPTVLVCADAVTSPAGVPSGTDLQFNATGTLVGTGATFLDLLDPAVGYFRVRFWNRTQIQLEFVSL